METTLRKQFLLEAFDKILSDVNELNIAVKFDEKVKEKAIELKKSVEEILKMC